MTEYVDEIALILLVLRLISVAFVVMVLRIQIKLMKMDIESELVGFRNVMLSLGYVLLIGSFLPIVVDFYFAFMSPSATFSIIVYYAISNCLSHLAAAVLLFNIYRIAENEIIMHRDNETNRLVNEEIRLQNVSDRQAITDDRKTMDEEVQDGINTSKR